MPAVRSKKLGVALDMYGCPNRCRHCYLGYGTNHQMSADDVRWMATQFRDYFRHSGINKSLEISSFFREPDFADEYRQLYELARELSDEEPKRHELLSIWRLAHDRDYAPWAKSVGPQTCQITFFGMEATPDWFYRRQGAFHVAVSATERLLDAGMKPRWQTESDLYKSIIENEYIPDADESLLDEPRQFRFFVTNNWDDFSNVGTLEPWWKLGNLKADSVATIMRRFERDEVPGLNILLHYPQNKLARKYGDPLGKKVYSGRGDLLDLYLARYCEKAGVK